MILENRTSSEGKIYVETRRIDERYHSEAVAWCDVNGDGIMDLVIGPYWYEGPDFEVSHMIFAQTPPDPRLGYAPITQPIFPHDFTGNGLPDLFCVVREPGPKNDYGFYGWKGEPGWKGVWFENPGKAGGFWTSHLVLDNIANESVVWSDIDGDGKPELVYASPDAYGYAHWNKDTPRSPWCFCPVSVSMGGSLKHGIGVGDLNGNGRLDLIGATGWWEHPASPEPGKLWEFHPVTFANRAMQIFSLDLDGDGQNELVTVWDAHGYGMVYHDLNTELGSKGTWDTHEILSRQGLPLNGEQPISQLHALEVLNLFGDGRSFILTGKRFWAHGPEGDVGSGELACLVAYEVGSEMEVTFTRHLLHDNSGVGNQIAVQPGTALTPALVAVSNKKGVFIHKLRWV